MTAEAPHSVTSTLHAVTELRGSYAHILQGDASASLGSMEGIYEPIISPSDRPAAKPAKRAEWTAGLLAAGIVSALAYALHVVPIAPFTVASEAGVRHPISASMIAILVGLTVGNLMQIGGLAKSGCKHIVKKLIPVAIVCMGAGLNLTHIASIGLSALLIIAICIAVAILSAYFIGKALGLSTTTSLLLGAGTGICGNSAIVAVAPCLQAEDEDVLLSIGTVNLFGLAAMLAWPVLGKAMAMSGAAFGIWAGTSIHAVPQVVAAGFAFGPEAGALATLVKLVRVTFLAPVVFLFALIHSRNHAAKTSETGSTGDKNSTKDKKLTVKFAALVPWFVWAFLCMALLNTLGLLPTLHFESNDLFANSPEGATFALGGLFSKLGKIILTLAMAAIGLDVSLRRLAGVGARAVAAGLFATLAVGGTSLALIWLLL